LPLVLKVERPLQRKMIRKLLLLKLLLESQLLVEREDLVS
jgi:hypothetical protein